MGNTVISEKLVVNGSGAEVVFDGFDFTGNGYVEIKNARSVTVKNCRVFNMDCPHAKHYWLSVFDDIPVKLVVENCFFGDNIGGVGKVYNLIQPTAQLADGSSISNNYFSEGCCTHNIINVYGAVDGANITINGNVIEMTAGGIRIGIKGDKVCKVNIRNNIVLATNPAYDDVDQGLVTIQPYDKQTISFGDVTLALSGNVVPCDQLVYAGYKSTDTVLNEITMPKVIVNGKIVDVPIYQW